MYYKAIKILVSKIIKFNFFIYHNVKSIVISYYLFNIIFLKIKHKCEMQDFLCVQIWLTKFSQCSGADVDLRDNDGDTPLHLALCGRRQTGGNDPVCI